MHASRILAFASITAALLFGATIDCDAKTPASIPLFNGKNLDGWVVYGKNNSPDAAKTWGVRNGVITDTGTPNGYIRTEKRYSNYRLTVEWCWLDAPVDAKGKTKRRNSGVILHMQGEDNVWPKSIEAQLMEKNAGDFWIIGGVDTNEHKAGREKALAAAGDDEKAKNKARKERRLKKKNNSSEKPTGEWNRYDIVCDGDTITLTVNGVEQNRVTGVTVSEGHICLQSEGAAMEFRNVVLTPLK